jgi:spore maturation protein CgeB
MKILITGSKINSGLAMSYVRAFRQLNCEIELFPDNDLYEEGLNVFKNRYIRGLVHRLFWKFFCRPINKKFLGKIEQYNPDLIFILKGLYLAPKTFSEIKRRWPKKALFIFNQENPFNIWNFSYSNTWIIKSIPIFDFYFTWGKFIIKPLQKAGAKKVEYLPFGYDPELHYCVNVSDAEIDIYGSDIAFIGSWDKEREYWLNNLLDYDLKIWGNNWGKANKKLQEKWQKRSAEGEEFVKVCSASKITLDILRRQMLPAHSMKTFEITGAGGTLMCNRGGEVYNFFEEAKEIITFQTPEEMIEKINFYLDRSDLRMQIRKNSIQKVVNYTYFNRVKKIIEIYDNFRKEKNLR